MSINELQDEVIAEFSDFDDWMDRYQLLIDLGNEQEPLEEKYKTEQNLIEGCQSRVWLQADDVDGKIVFKALSGSLVLHSSTTVSTNRTLSRRGRKKKSFAAACLSLGGIPVLTRCALRTIIDCSA